MEESGVGMCSQVIMIAGWFGPWGVASWPSPKKNQGPATKHKADCNACCLLVRPAPLCQGQSRKQDKTGSEAVIQSLPRFPIWVIASQNITFAERLNSKFALKGISSPDLGINFWLTGQILSFLWAQDCIYFHDKRNCLVFQQMKTKI